MTSSERASKTACIFLVTHLVPYPPARGVELRILKLLKWLKAEGHRVILIIPAESIEACVLDELKAITHRVYWTKPALRTRLGSRFPSLRRALWEPVKPLLKLWRLENGNTHARDESTSVGDVQTKKGLCPEALVHLVGKLARKYRPQAIIAEYIFLTPCFARLPSGTLKIVDTIDVFSRKQDQVLAFGVDDPCACSEEEERLALLRADTVLAIQAREAEMLKALVPECRVLLVGMDFEVANGMTASLGKPDTITVVGSNNPLNVHGLTGFLNTAWAQIKAAHPTAVLNIVGKVGNECHVEDPDIRYTAWVDDLADVYKDSRVVINPTIAGTGLKIKSAEAVAHGKPLVLWPHGADGLEHEGDPPYVMCRSWREFSQAIVRLLQSEDEARALGECALRYARTRFNPASVYGPLKTRLDEHLSLRPDQSSLTRKPMQHVST